MQTELKPLLDQNNVSYIKSLTELSNLYDFDKLIESGETKVNVQKNSIIIFDTHIFNSCYVIDEYNKFIEDNNELKDKFSVYYCDDLLIYEKVFKKYFGPERWNESFTKPVILLLNCHLNEIDIIEEGLIPFSKEVFVSINHIFDERIIQH